VSSCQRDYRRAGGKRGRERRLRAGSKPAAPIVTVSQEDCCPVAAAASGLAARDPFEIAVRTGDPDGVARQCHGHREIDGPALVARSAGARIQACKRVRAPTCDPYAMSIAVEGDRTTRHWYRGSEKVEPLRISPATPTATHARVARTAPTRHASKPRRHRSSVPQPVARVAAAPVQTATPVPLTPQVTPAPVRHAPPPPPRRHQHRAAPRPAPARAAPAPPPPADDEGHGDDDGDGDGHGHGHGHDGEGDSPTQLPTVQPVVPVPPPLPTLEKHGKGHGQGGDSQGSADD
jgi:hypothetical protein